MKHEVVQMITFIIIFVIMVCIIKGLTTSRHNTDDLVNGDSYIICNFEYEPSTTNEPSTLKSDSLTITNEHDDDLFAEEMVYIHEPISDEEICTDEETVYEDDYISEECTDEVYFTEYEINLIALLTMAEAEGECEYGKRLVIDTIFNRIDDDHFPDTVYDVIYQPNQFSAVWNGRIDRCYVKEDIVSLVEQEIVSRTDNDVIFFMSGSYSIYGSPMFKVDNHYFSSYN